MKFLLAALLVLSVATYAQADHSSRDSDSDDSSHGRYKRSALWSASKLTAAKRTILRSPYLKTAFLRLFKDVLQANTAPFKVQHVIRSINVNERPWVPDHSGTFRIPDFKTPPCYEISSPGLSGTPGSVSIRLLARHPPTYALAAGGLMKAAAFKNTESFKKCASFIMLNDPWEQCHGCVSFRSECFPNQFIRHQGYVLKHGPYEELDLYFKDSTFKFTKCT